MLKVLFVFAYLFYLGSATNGEFLCNDCGSVISDYKDVIDKQSDDSIGKKRMSFIPQDHIVEYDVFSEIVHE